METLQQSSDCSHWLGFISLGVASESPLPWLPHWPPHCLTSPPRSLGLACCHCLAWDLLCPALQGDLWSPKVVLCITWVPPSQSWVWTVWMAPVRAHASTFICTPIAWPAPSSPMHEWPNNISAMNWMFWHLVCFLLKQNKTLEKNMTEKWRDSGK